MHKALVEAQGGISGELHAAFQGMLLAMQDVPAVLIVLADSLRVCKLHVFLRTSFSYRTSCSD